MEQYNYPLFNQDYILLDGGPNLGGCISKKTNQQQQPQHHHNHHQQANTATITTPECFLNDSFVDFSELHINSHLKGQACITTHIYQPNIAKRRTRQRRSRANRNSSKCSLKAQPRPRHGISSFQSFNVTSESVMSIRSIMEKQQNLVSARARRSAPPSSYIRKPSSRFVRMDKAAEKENLPKFSRRRGKFRPTILKGRRKGGKANLKLRALNQGNSPIKTLTFSPSRFLNTSTLTAPEEITKQPPQGDVVKELSFDETPFDIEDSGIGGYEHDLTEPLVPPSLTSTPISSRRRTGNKNCSVNKPLSDPEIELPFLDNSESEELNWLLDSTTSLSDNGAPEFAPSKTLTSNASDSFFPGSSSYNFLDSDTDTTFPTFSYDDLSSGFDPDDLNSINLYPLDFSHTPKAVADSKLEGSQIGVGKADNHHHHQQQHDSGTTKKSARKSLVLDDVVISSDSSSTLLKVPLKSSTTTTASNLLHTLHSKHEQSALVGSKMVMEKRVLAPGKKSVYLTRPRRLPNTVDTLVFDQHWVQVACGRTHDQKAMTEAARRCLTSFRKRHYVK